jgi:hypothetical protein
VVGGARVKGVGSVAGGVSGSEAFSHPIMHSAVQTAVIAKNASPGLHRFPEFPAVFMSAGKAGFMPHGSTAYGGRIVGINDRTLLLFDSGAVRSERIARPWHAAC